MSMKKWLQSVSFLLILAVLFGFSTSCGMIPPAEQGGATAENVAVTVLEPDSAIDHLAWQKSIDEIIERQQKNGFTVEEVIVLYISEEEIREDPVAAERLVRLTVGEFEGFDTPIRLTVGGVVEGEVIPEDAAFSAAEADGGDWTNYIQRMVLGSGILMISIALNMATGGTFLCAATALVGSSAAEAGASALAGYLFSYVANLNAGLSPEEAAAIALKEATNAGSAAFLSNAMVGAMVTPLVRMCFPEGAFVATPSGAMPIEDVGIGDMVYTYSDGQEVAQPVLDVIVGCTATTVTITLDDGQVLTTTNSHLFYDPDEEAYIPAEELLVGDELLTLSGERAVVTAVELHEAEACVPVYNLSTANHTYFVCDDEDDDAVLVHNSCLHRSAAWYKERKRYWREQAEFYDMNPQYMEKISITKKYFLSEDNLKLMRRGKAPFGVDGKRVQLHHYLAGGIETDMYSYLELTATEHQVNTRFWHKWLYD